MPMNLDVTTIKTAFYISIPSSFAAFTYISKLFIEQLVVPQIQKQQLIVGKISHALTFYANLFPQYKEDNVSITNSKDLIDGQKDLRDLASELKATKSTIPNYKILAKLGFVLKEAQVDNASSNLIGWSNSLFDREYSSVRHNFRLKVAAALNFPI